MEKRVPTAHMKRTYALRRFVTKLVQALMEPYSPIPALNGVPVHQGKRYGVAYAFPAIHHPSSRPATWFKPIAERQGVEALFTVARCRVVPVVNWELLLSKACPLSLDETGTYDKIREAAYLLWILLADFVEVFDYAFAEEIRLRGTLDEFLALDAAANTDALAQKRVQIFYNHTRRFLQNKKLVRPFLRKTMKSIFASPFSWVKEEQMLPRCRSSSSPSHICDACRHLKWLHTNTSVLDLDSLKDTRLLRTMTYQHFVPPDLFEGDFTNPWWKEMRMLLSADDLLLGVKRLEDYDQILVNWSIVAQNAHEWRGSAAIQSVVESAFPTDFLRTGLAARRYMARFQLEATRVIPLYELTQQAGWPDYDLQFTPCEVYSFSKMASIVKRAGVSLARLRKRDARGRRPTVIKQRRPPKVAKVTYVDPSGRSCDIRVVRRKRLTEYGMQPANHFELPFWVNEGTSPKERLGLAVSVQGLLYWNERGLNRLANKVDSTDEYGNIFYTYPEAKPFLAWVQAQEHTLTRAKFKELLYDAATPQRSQELLEGKRKRLARFSLSEIETLKRILFEQQDKALRRLSCETELPGRSWAGIRKQIELLGYEYAREHGYKAYEASPYFINYSISRRRRWAKKGVSGAL